MKHANKIRLDEAGFASMVIALIMVLLMSLITVGFSQFARREQKSSLDKQLATQAYYAAETGVNDAIQKVTDNYYNLNATQKNYLKPDKCLSPTELTSLGLTPSIDNSRGISYSCISIDVNPPKLLFGGVSPGSERSSTFSADGTLNSITINWGSESGRATFRSSGGFTPKNSWTAPSVLQVMLTPIGGGSRAELQANTFVTYLYPADNTMPNRGSVTYDPANNQAAIVNGDCDSTRDFDCKVKINGIPASGSYLIRIVNYYDVAKIQIDTATGSCLSGTECKFKDGQAVIDVTGRARDVLKRIQVTAPIGKTPDIPEYVLDGQNLCKRITTEPNSTDDGSPYAGCKVW